jgi:SAM-dependent methyltransferase
VTGLHPRRLVQRAAATAVRTRLRSRGWSDRLTLETGVRFSRFAQRLMRYPHREENVEIPPPSRVDDHVFDVVEDLVAYTGLAREQVVALLRREHDNFRLEWHALPPAVREERWYYLASRTYVFANAVHSFDAESFLARLAAASPPPGRVLDFGGGSGNLSLALAATGYDVDFLELSALQKDFVRYRVQLHELTDRVSVLDSWARLDERAYDMVCAFDVLEHLDDLGDILKSQIVPALKPGGVLVESSPFVRTISNPMHHEDEIGFDASLGRLGLELDADEGDYRIWRLTARTK